MMGVFVQYIVYLAHTYMCWCCVIVMCGGSYDLVRVVWLSSVNDFAQSHVRNMFVYVLVCLWTVNCDVFVYLLVFVWLHYAVVHMIECVLFGCPMCFICIWLSHDLYDNVY